MAAAEPNISQELTNTIISLQETIRSVQQKITHEQQAIVFDPTQPIGHLLDNTSATDILSLAKPTSEIQADLSTLTARLSALQTTLQERNQWLPALPRTPIPCSTDYLDLSDLSTAVRLIADIVARCNPSSELTPRTALAGRE